MPLQARPNLGSARVSIIITRPTVFRRRPVDVGEEFHDVTPQEWLEIQHKARIRPLPPSAQSAAAAPAAAAGRETTSAEPRTEVTTSALKNPRKRPAGNV